LAIFPPASVIATAIPGGGKELLGRFPFHRSAARRCAGFELVPLEGWRTNAQITLEPWGHLKGTLRPNHQPAPHGKVELTEDLGFGSRFDQDGFQARAITD
jgi:hypothetical protein